MQRHPKEARSLSAYTVMLLIAVVERCICAIGSIAPPTTYIFIHSTWFSVCYLACCCCSYATVSLHTAPHSAAQRPVAHSTCCSTFHILLHIMLLFHILLLHVETPPIVLYKMWRLGDYYMWSSKLNKEHNICSCCLTSWCSILCCSR